MFINFIGKSFHNIRYLVTIKGFFCLVVMTLNNVNVSKNMGGKFMRGSIGSGPPPLPLENEKLLNLHRKIIPNMPLTPHRKHIYALQKRRKRKY